MDPSDVQPLDMRFIRTGERSPRKELRDPDGDRNERQGTGKGSGSRARNGRQPR